MQQEDRVRALLNLSTGAHLQGWAPQQIRGGQF